MQQNNIIKKRNGYLGIYVHFPYCIHKCSYCDFYSVGIGKTHKEQKKLFDTYKQELSYRLSELSLSKYIFDTIFIGGGTPSLSDKNQLADLIEYILVNVQNSESIEISIEMNPEDVSSDLLDFYHSIGVNRVNVGVQSFQPKLLSLLERYYNPIQYSKLLETLGKSKITNFGIDLIYGIPGQTKEIFIEDLLKALNSQIKHISLYSLTVEPNTLYYKQVLNGAKEEPLEELQSMILLELPSILQEYGFRQYEVSNYSKIGYESRHNLRYWAMDYYLGIGPGAHGYTPNGRYGNKRGIEEYKNQDWDSNYIPSNYLEEMAMSVFRLFLPIDINSFIEIVPEKKEDIYRLISKWSDRSLCYWKNGIFQWKKESVLYLDDYILEFTRI